jgi:hypothetical protein
MSQCPYCRRELPGFESVCKNCFDAGYEQVLHPKPWWQRRQLWHRPRLSRNCVFVFLMVFTFMFLDIRVDWVFPHTNKEATLWALAAASVSALVESTRRPRLPAAKKDAGKFPAP